MATHDEGNYLAPDQLRIGVFVILDLPWFKHPFTLNSFKIRTAEQLRELKSLRLARYRYDPDRSDLPEELFSVPPEPTAPAPAHEASPAAVLDPAMAEKQARIQRLAERRQQMADVERAFAKASALMRTLNRNLPARPQETLADLGALVGQMVAVFLDSPEATLHVMGEKAGAEDVYHHSLNVAILAMMLAKDLGLGSAEAREMGIGALIHDIGLSQIPDRVLNKKPEEYSTAERNLRRQHVQYGVAIGRQAGVSTEALAVIAQHHELADGSGYPQGLRAAQMTRGAQLVSMVNYYDNLCNPFEISQALTPHEALSLMFAQRRGKFEAAALQLMIRCLGVYPPGTIVQLANEALGLVMSVNPKKPLHPWVMIYDESVPKEEAIILNLEEDASLGIARALRPVALPARVLAYLNPRQRVTYYFDAGEQAGAGRP